MHFFIFIFKNIIFLIACTKEYEESLLQQVKDLGVFGYTSNKKNNQNSQKNEDIYKKIKKNRNSDIIEL